jgi:3-oxoadipate enol-lactonase
MQRSHVTLGDGCRLAYRFDGPDEAPVLVLSNSLGTNLDMWAPQMAALTARFRVLRYDSRGHGASDVPAGAYSMDRLGRDVVELLDALQLDRVAFCGLSKGGMVGQWLGYRAPDRLERLVLCNTSAYMGPPGGWDDRIAAVRQSGMPAVTETVLDRWFTPAFRAQSDAAVARVREMLLATDPVGYAGCCAAIRDMDNRPMLPLIFVPTLVIAGTSDPATPPDHAREIAAGVADSSLVMLLAAHLSNVEQSSLFTRALIEFLA